MQVLIPMSSHSSFFPDDEYFFPKPLIEVAGRPMIELVVNQLKKQLNNPQFTFVIDHDDAHAFSLGRICELAGGAGTNVIERMGKTSSGLTTCSFSTAWRHGFRFGGVRHDPKSADNKNIK